MSTDIQVLPSTSSNSPITFSNPSAASTTQTNLNNNIIPQVPPSTSINTNSNSNEQNSNSLQYNEQNSNSSNIPTLTPEMQTEILSGIQNASRNGATELPTSHIPMTTTHIVNDPNINTNYVPPSNNKYINENLSLDQIKLNSLKEKNNNTKKMQLLEELKIPIIISCIFFIFQQPAFNLAIIRLIPKFGKKTATLNLGGLLFKSLLFGISFYLFAKSMDHFNNF